MPSSSLTARACYPKGSNIGGLGTMKKILNKQSSYINQGKLKELEKDNQKRNQKKDSEGSRQEEETAYPK